MHVNYNNRIVVSFAYEHFSFFFSVMRVQLVEFESRFEMISNVLSDIDGGIDGTTATTTDPTHTKYSAIVALERIEFGCSFKRLAIDSMNKQMKLAHHMN